MYSAYFPAITPDVTISSASFAACHSAALSLSFTAAFPRIRQSVIGEK